MNADSSQAGVHGALAPETPVDQAAKASTADVLNNRQPSLARTFGPVAKPQA